MANQQIGNNWGVAAVSVGNGTTNRSNINGSTGAPDTAYIDTDGDSISAMRTRLATISAGTYTSAYLDKMTENDMKYAIRQNDSASTIK